MHITNIFLNVKPRKPVFKDVKINSIALLFAEIIQKKENRVIKLQFIAFSFNIKMNHIIKA